jgi:hypothetical protein
MPPLGTAKEAHRRPPGLQGHQRLAHLPRRHRAVVVRRRGPAESRVRPDVSASHRRG